MTLLAKMISYISTLLVNTASKEGTMKFTDMKLKPYIQEALKEINFVQPTEVQEKLIPVVLSGRDLIGESKQVRVRPIPS